MLCYILLLLFLMHKHVSIMLMLQLLELILLLSFVQQIHPLTFNMDHLYPKVTGNYSRKIKLKGKRGT